MKKVCIVAEEHEGLETRIMTIPLIVEMDTINIKDIRKAVSSACEEYVQTEEGKRVYHYNCGCFDWADFWINVPNEICEKYGFTKDEEYESDLHVNWNEELVDDALYSDDEGEET